MDPVFANGQNITGNNGTDSKPYPTRLEAFEAPARAFLVCLFTTTGALALTGNIVVILVERYGTRSARNLRKFLTNLAVSDILFGVICVPFSYTDFMLGQWIFPFWLCPLTAFVQVLSVFVTTFTLTVIGIERYLVILYPLSGHIHVLTDKCNLILTLGWIIGSVLASYPMMHTKTVGFVWNGEPLTDCRPNYSDPLLLKCYSTLVFVVTFAAPLLLQSYSYASIARRLLGRTGQESAVSLRRSNSLDEDRAKIVKMLVAVVIAFAICWLPIKAFMLLFYFWPQMSNIYDDFTYYRYVVTYFFCHWLAMANSFVNPIIYSFMSKSFRADLADITKQIKNKLSPRRIHMERANSSSTNGTNGTATRLTTFKNSSVLQTGQTWPPIFTKV